METPSAAEINHDEALSFEAFCSRWFEGSGFETQDDLKLFWYEAASHYEDAEHHNFDHAKETLWAAMELADLCETNGDMVHRKSLIGAALFHDAGNHEKPQEHGYDTPELYASALFAKAATRHGFSKEDTDFGKISIKATAAGVVPVTREERIMVRADINNVGGDYTDSFFSTTLDILKEERRRTAERGELFDISIFGANSVTALAKYLVNDLSLGAYDTDWQERALANLKRHTRFLAMCEAGRSLEEYVRRIGSPALGQVLGLPSQRRIAGY